MAIEFRLLGDIEAAIDDDVIDLGHARQRCVLAALLVDANHAVPAERIAARVWGNVRRSARPQRCAATCRGCDVPWPRPPRPASYGVPVVTS